MSLRVVIRSGFALAIMVLASMTLAAANGRPAGTPLSFTNHAQNAFRADGNCIPSIYTDCISVQAGEQSAVAIFCQYCLNGSWSAEALKAKGGLPSDKLVKTVATVFGIGFCGNLCMEVGITASKCVSRNGKIRYVDKITANGAGGPYTWNIAISCV